MIFKAKQKAIYITVSIIMIIVVMAYSLYKEVDTTRHYFNKIFEEAAHEINYVVDEINQNKEKIESILQDSSSISVTDQSSKDIKFSVYPERGVGEYGFNQGVYQNTMAVGTLYGQGVIPKDLTKQEFLAFDDLWGNYRASLLTVLPYVVHYKKRYIYLSTLMQPGSKDAAIFPRAPSPLLYRQGQADTYQALTEQYGFFVSQPFESFITDSIRLFFVVPVYKNGEIIADFGSTIQIEELTHLLNVYPKLAKGVNIKLIYSNGFEYDLSDASYHTLSVYSVNYALPGGLIMSAQYDLLYFVTEKIQLFMTLCLLALSGFIIFNALHRRAQHQNRLGEQLYIDHMTGLYNRRIIENELIEKIEQNISHGEISFITIDADKFKQINDIHGHNVGDNAIVYIAKTLKKTDAERRLLHQNGGR